MEVPLNHTEDLAEGKTGYAALRLNEILGMMFRPGINVTLEMMFFSGQIESSRAAVINLSGLMDDRLATTALSSLENAGGGKEVHRKNNC